MRHKVRWCYSLSFVHHRTALAFVLFAFFPTLLAVYTQENEINMPHQEVEFWANKIGIHFSRLSDTFTQYDDIKANFVDSDAKILDNDGLQLVKEMAEDVTNMMKFKVQAVKRIMNVAEEASLDKGYKQDEEVEYYNAKRINPVSSDLPGNYVKGFKNLTLVKNSHFDGIPVNDNVSSVHVPTNVYDKAPDVIDAIRWSGRLDRTFKSNYELDPTLSWQYFGSSTGFLRQYPASQWVLDEKDPDLYDARLRSWYIEAANSPKDMVILLDVSGSMTGLRREIAKHVVLNILETLNENDFVNVFNFSDKTLNLVPCFNDTLVQANLENLGEFKKALNYGETKDIANFTQALTTAFELLHRYNKSGQGSQCNQAIMLVTDGAPYNYQGIFAKYNWPQVQVRMFTYLIGREEDKIRDLQWMACANKGYFVHVTTLAEVREQVLKYIPVMARPMVMYQDNHPHIWTGVYADIAGRREAPGLREGYRLMTSVSVPVFDRKKTSVKTANLLGVAGTDVPIREIEKLVPPYKLGVNGYSFMVNGNGYVLYHPDLRPVFQDILKPNYNSVDFAEVELIDNESGPRTNDSNLMTLRRDLIEQRRSEANLKVKIHMDNMKRVVQREQRYFTKKVDGTPFSLGIAMPNGYGRYKVYGQIEITRAIQDPRGAKAMDHFSSGNWTLHPDWVYCEFKYNQDRVGDSPEELMEYFFSRAQKPHWKWRSTRTHPPPMPTLGQQCDKDLVQSLLFDARATNVYGFKRKLGVEGLESFRRRFGITTAFVATRSGLTRWEDLTRVNPDEDTEQREPPSDEPHFMKLHNRAIDEVWYKRAVDYYEEDPEAYVYSVPFDAATRNPEEVLVTATRAIFIQETKYYKAPAAVVGITFKHSNFVQYFKNETYSCPSYPSRDSNCKITKTCESKSLDCYLLDDNGFIVVSENEDDTGKFFGTLEGTIMESLVQSEVYKKIRIFDYQAVCLDSQLEPSMASILTTPIQMIRWTANWIMGNIFWLLVKTHLYTLWDPNEAWAYTHPDTESEYLNVYDPPQDVYDEKEPNLDGPRTYDVADYLSDEGLVETFPEDAAAEGNFSDIDYGSTNVESADEEDILEEYSDVLEGLYYDIDGIHSDYHPDLELPYEEEDGEFPSLELAYINKTHPRPCDKEVYLYKLQNQKLLQDGAYKPVKGKLSNCHQNGCGRPFSVQKVVSSNLILVAVNNLCPCESRKVDIQPVEVEYNKTMHCNRLLLQHLRKRPTSCHNYHPDEQDIKQCGGAGALSLPSVALPALLLLLHACNSLRLHS